MLPTPRPPASPIAAEWAAAYWCVVGLVGLLMPHAPDLKVLGGLAWGSFFEAFLLLGVAFLGFRALSAGQSRFGWAHAIGGVAFVTWLVNSYMVAHAF